MGTVTINASGVGAAQSGTVTTAGGSGGGIIMVTNHSDATITFDVATAGTVVQSDLVIGPKDYQIVTGLNNGAQTLVNLSTSHGSASLVYEVVFNRLVTYMNNEAMITHIVMVIGLFLFIYYLAF